jgi:hypothetical protein
VKHEAKIVGLRTGRERAGINFRTVLLEPAMLNGSGEGGSSN